MYKTIQSINQLSMQLASMKGFLPIRNSLRLELSNESGLQTINRVDVLKSLANVQGFKMEFVDYVSQLYNNYTWYISFKEQYMSNRFIGQVVKLNDKEFQLQDGFLPPQVLVEMRISWLPHGHLPKLRSFLRKFNLTPVSLKDEYMKEPAFKDIKTGNLFVKCKVEENKASTLAGGVHELEVGLQILVQIKGEPSKCFTCNGTGHIRRNCPKRKLKCDSCKKKGHATIECTMAHRISRNQENLPDEDEEQDEEQDINADQNEQEEDSDSGDEVFEGMPPLEERKGQKRSKQEDESSDGSPAVTAKPSKKSTSEPAVANTTANDEELNENEELIDVKTVDEQIKKEFLEKQKKEALRAANSSSKPGCSTSNRSSNEASAGVSTASSAVGSETAKGSTKASSGGSSSASAAGTSSNATEKQKKKEKSKANKPAIEIKHTQTSAMRQSISSNSINKL